MSSQGGRQQIYFLSFLVIWQESLSGKSDCIIRLSRVWMFSCLCPISNIICDGNCGARISCFKVLKLKQCNDLNIFLLHLTSKFNSFQIYFKRFELQTINKMSLYIYVHLLCYYLIYIGIVNCGPINSAWSTKRSKKRKKSAVFVQLK